ncbi:MAG: ergothioneine biosynthesis protein EgtB [Planctomycetota bacterium]
MIQAAESTQVEPITIEAAYEAVRERSLQIARPLSAEDCAVQSMPDASPIRWHLAHTTWFFETFLLRGDPTYQVFDPGYEYLFNSYYNQVGEQYPRTQRGLITRPGLDETLAYRTHVDRAMLRWLRGPSRSEEQTSVLRTGLNHEQQHQELMLTDIKHALSCNPLWPVYDDRAFESSTSEETDWSVVEPGQYEIGHVGPGFAFDNESPRHTVYLNGCKVSGSLVTCGEYLRFMNEGGYERPEFWLSLGWSHVQDEGWTSPLYWVRRDDQWFQFTLAGLKPVCPEWPVCHVSLFEADAYARWAGQRLTTEFEWEVAQRQCADADSAESVPDQFADHLLNHQKAIHPTRNSNSLLGGVWQWTSSSYAAYPGYRPPEGALGEYNGKFMCNQYVLRGGSVATDSQHVRPTYRNFFPADARWQFTGIRVAQSL